MIDISLHTHTTFSDGKCTISEMLNQAEEKGLQTIGISDHLIVNHFFSKSPSLPRLSSPNISHVYRQDFSKAAEAFLRHYEQILSAAQNRSLKVLVGAEVDYFTYPGWKDGFRTFQEKVPLDYYLSGNHFVVDEKNVPINIDDVEKFISREKQADYIRRHFNTICLAIKSGLFDFIAHIDYIRRLPLCQDGDFIEEKRRVLKTLAECKIATEYSTKGLRNSGSCFPCLWMLQELKQLQVPLIVTDDAHHTAELAFKFKEAEDNLRQLGYPCFWKPEV